MPVRFYLKLEAVEDVRQRRSHGLQTEGKRQFFQLYESFPDIEFPEFLRESDVQEITAHQPIPVVPKRALGIYRCGQAEAVLEVEIPRMEEVNELRISSTNLEDAKKLFCLIRSGKIYPVENWEGPQISPRRGPRWPGRQRWQVALGERWRERWQAALVAVRRWCRAVINALCRLKLRLRRGR